MKKLITLILFTAVAISMSAQFTPGDTLKYRISLKDKAATEYSLQKPEKYLSVKSIERRKRKAFTYLLPENGITLSLSPVMIVC